MIHQIKFNKSEIWKFSALETSDLRVASGVAWVTASGCNKDMIVAAGEKLPSTRTEILVQSLSDDLVVEYVSARPPKKFRFNFRDFLEKSHLVSAKSADAKRKVG